MVVQLRFTVRSFRRYQAKVNHEVQAEAEREKSKLNSVVGACYFALWIIALTGDWMANTQKCGVVASVGTSAASTTSRRSALSSKESARRKPDECVRWAVSLLIASIVARRFAKLPRLKRDE